MVARTTIVGIAARGLVQFMAGSLRGSELGTALAVALPSISSARSASVPDLSGAMGLRAATSPERRGQRSRLRPAGHCRSGPARRPRPDRPARPARRNRDRSRAAIRVPSRRPGGIEVAEDAGQGPLVGAVRVGNGEGVGRSRRGRGVNQAVSVRRPPRPDFRAIGQGPTCGWGASRERNQRSMFPLVTAETTTCLPSGFQFAEWILLNALAFSTPIVRPVRVHDCHVLVADEVGGSCCRPERTSEPS